MSISDSETFLRAWRGWAARTWSEGPLRLRHVATHVRPTISTLVQVIEVQSDHYDRAYFRQWADKLGIRELAEEALAEAWD